MGKVIFIYVRDGKVVSVCTEDETLKENVDYVITDENEAERMMNEE